MCLWKAKCLPQNSPCHAVFFDISGLYLPLNGALLPRRAGAVVAGIEDVVTALGERRTTVVMQTPGTWMLTAKAGTIGRVLPMGRSVFFSFDDPDLLCAF